MDLIDLYSLIVTELDETKHINTRHENRLTN